MSEDFEQINLEPFMKHNGGLLFRTISENEYEFKTNIKENHLNAAGITHGGFISAIVDTEDRSRQTRFRYYQHALETIKESPVFGIGLGNWKIYSIKKDSQNIRSYILPYNVHNDILEFTAETGIIGGILFLSFFIYLALFVIKDFNLNPNDLYLDNYSLFIMLPFIFYFTDLNLNFPSTRPENLYLLLIYIAYVFSTKYQLDDAE